VAGGDGRHFKDVMVEYAGCHPRIFLGVLVEIEKSGLRGSLCRAQHATRLNNVVAPVLSLSLDCR
jgi:hypothetical protein